MGVRIRRIKTYSPSYSCNLLEKVRNTYSIVHPQLSYLFQLRFLPGEYYSTLKKKTGK